MSLRKSWRLLPLVGGLAAVLMLLYFVIAGLCLGNAEDDNVPTRLRYHALPVGMSVLYYGKRHDLTGYNGLAGQFHNPAEKTAELISRYSQGVDRDYIRDTGNYYWVADDRGVGDYVILAFALFGPHASSFYWLYCLLLAAIVGAYVAGLHRDRLSMVLLPLLLGGYVVALFSVAAAPPNPSVQKNLLPIYDSRTFDALALIGFAHLALLAIGRVAFTRLGLWAIGVQVTLLTFLLLSRSALKLEILALGLIVALLALRALRKLPGAMDWRAPRASWHRLIAMPAVVACFSLIAVPLFAELYQFAVYHKEYRKTERTVWHNILMGVGTPDPGEQWPRVRGDDLETARAVAAWHNARHPQDVWEGQTILNSLGSYGKFDWKEYERTARSMVFAMWRDHPLTMLKWYMIDKPYLAFSVLKGQAQQGFSLPSPQYSSLCLRNCETGLRITHWPVIALLLIAALAARDIVRRYWWPVFGALIAGALVCLLPAVIFYAFPHAFLGAVVLGAAAIYWAMMGVFAKLGDYLSTRFPVPAG